MAVVTHEEAATSNHSAIMVNWGETKERPKARDFKYDLMWESHEGLHTVVMDEWDAGPPCTTVEELRQKLANLAGGLSRWSNDTFGSIRKEIKMLKKKLEELRTDPLPLGPSHMELKINND